MTLLLKRCGTAVALLVAPVSQLAAHESSKFELVYQDTFPGALRRFDVKSAHFRGDNKECLVVHDPACFRTFTFDAGTWRPRDTIPLELTGDTFTVSSWTVGDVNDGYRDEIVAAAGRTLITYLWNGESFVPKKQGLPYFVDDIKVGDIDNDGRNELVMLTYTQPLPDTHQWDFYDVAVSRDSDTGVVQLWNDNRKLKIGRNGPVPSDRLVCVADVMGVGRNQLLGAGGQSDVSATPYFVLEWSGNGLEEVCRLVIEGGRLVLSPPADDPRNAGEGSSIGDWVPVQIGAESMFLIPWITADASLERATVLARISEGKLEVAETLPRPGGFHYNSLWIDPDGHGKGVLELPDYCGANPFLFYRRKTSDRQPLGRARTGPGQRVENCC